jgi:hypothetical protein
MMLNSERLPESNMLNSKMLLPSTSDVSKGTLRPLHDPTLFYLREKGLSLP